jgi:hypothetical protein
MKVRISHPVDVPTFQAILKRANALPVDALDLSVRLAPQDPHLCTSLGGSLAFAQLRLSIPDCIILSPG